MTETGDPVPKDAEQVAADRGEVTEAQRLANENLQQQIKAREERDQANQAPKSEGPIERRIREAAERRAQQGGSTAQE